MFTKIITFLIFFAVIGCISYGRKLIKAEKVDAVFGNPERAKGGTHWIIVGSSFLLLTWLYYSWDIAKGFYPKSANELCQVAKVNDSLLSLKYLFPIEERELKSTSIIKLEGKNIKKYEIKIQNSLDLNDQNKSKLLKFLTKTKNTIPLLTNENLIENETKNKINEITSKINNLTEEFQKIYYASETFEEKNKRSFQRGTKTCRNNTTSTTTKTCRDNSTSTSTTKTKGGSTTSASLRTMEVSWN